MIMKEVEWKDLKVEVEEDHKEIIWEDLKVEIEEDHKEEIEEDHKEEIEEDHKEEIEGDHKEVIWEVKVNMKEEDKEVKNMNKLIKMHITWSIDVIN
jgi:hypothetical protein